ncbi:MAG: neutral/alkaline non-lysosomal ceramidase N-terminal domain-containing protein [Ginsengibacter sp.]
MDFQSYQSFKHSSFRGFIGVAQVDITPPLGIYSRNWGAAKQDVAEGIHQPLVLTCMTFQSSLLEKPLILIAADLGGWKNSTDEWIFRNKLLTALAIEAPQLMVCLSHTHAGPIFSRDYANKPGGEYMDSYLDHLGESGVRAAQNALNSAVPAVLTWHYGTCKLATNRDLPDVLNNRFVVGFNPDKNADNTLLVGRVTDEQNRITGTIVNYACHPTTLAWDNQLISPDYVGSMRRLVEANTQAPCLFLQGASGELSPAEQYLGNTDIAEKNGRQLGYAVMATLESMLPPNVQLSFCGIIESGAPLALWKQTPYKPPGQLSAKMVEVPFNLKPLPSLVEIEQQYLDCEDRVMKERLLRKRGVRIAVGNGEVSQMPLWVWQLGDSFLVGQPNEAYSQFQEQLRSQLAPKAVAVMNLVNGGVGYLPPRELYGKEIYQEWQTPFAAGSLELLIQVATETARELIVEK